MLHPFWLRQTQARCDRRTKKRSEEGGYHYQPVVTLTHSAGWKSAPYQFQPGVSIEAVRKRLGHSSTDTVKVYAELADQAADAEIRASRRKRETRR